MRIFEILKFVNALNESLILESFSQLKDKYKDASPEELTAAQTTYSELRNNPDLMTAFKKTLKPHGNFDQQIKLTYPTMQEFINTVAAIKTNIKAKVDTLAALKAAGYSKSQSKDMAKYSKYLQGDFYVIPCRSHEEVKEAANALTGNLPKGFSDKEIKDKWIIEDDHVVEKEGLVRKPGSYYEEIQKPDEANAVATQLSAKEYLNVYKTAPFFMQPSWCIAGSKNGEYFFKDNYHLIPDKDEKARCWVVISTKYPNVRFCITYRVKYDYNLPDNGPISNLKQLTKTKCMAGKTTTIDEVRDSWQMGDAKSQPIDMIKIFSNNIYTYLVDNFILLNKPVTTTKEYLLTKCEHWAKLVSNNVSSRIKKSNEANTDIVNIDIPDIVANNLFSDINVDIKKFNGKLSNLIMANSMFGMCNKLIEFNSDLPKLKQGSEMFYGCALSSFNVDLPNLTDGSAMFNSCEQLLKFDISMPKLSTAYSMFEGCKKLKSFDCDLPALKYGESMFSDCEQLKAFNNSLPKLKYSTNMFYNCKSLKSFEGNLANIQNGYSMFYNCKSLVNFNANLSSLEEGKDMFKFCKLDEKSVDTIFSSIPSYADSYGHNLNIGIGYYLEDDEIDSLKEKFYNKGWRVEIEMNL